jgi:trigger factor
MPSVVERRSPILVSLRVDVPRERVQQSLDDAYGKLQRSARIRGFRPGKVPKHVVKQLLGKSVRQELAAELVEEGLGLACTEHGLQPIAVANVDAPPLVEGEALTFKVDVEVRPTIDAVDTQALEVYRSVETVTETQVQQELARLREENAELVAPDPPRPAAAGDVVTFDLRVELDGRERPEFAMRDARTELGSHHVIETIEDALIGLDVGGTRSMEFPFSADHENAELRGKTAHCTVDLKGVQAKVLPELDDEFAKDLDHESLAALRESIETRLREGGEQRAAFRLREQVVERLVDRNPIAVPPTLIERQARAMLHEIVQLQRMLGRPLGLDDEMQEGLRRRAERKVQAGLLLTSLATIEDVKVEDADLDRKLSEIAGATGKHIAKVRAEHDAERLGALRSQLLEDKLVELLLARATIRDGEPPALGASGSAAAGTDAEPAATSKDDTGESESKPRAKGGRRKKGEP